MFERMNASRRIWGAAMVLLLAATVSFAASPLVGGGNQGSGDESLERELEGGIRVTCLGVFPNAERKDRIYVQYTIESEKDTVIKIGRDLDIFDSDGNQIGYEYVWIGNRETREREIIAGVKTLVVIRYDVSNDYKMTPRYARVSFNIGDKTLHFRNVPSHSTAQ